MKKNPVIGITAEWNPFHSGHAAMIKEIRKSFPDARIISAMSGSFVQRESLPYLINGAELPGASLQA